MPSEPLSPDNDYQFPPAPAKAALDRAAFNGFAASIGARLRGLEAKRVELQDVIDDLRLFGLERLDTAIVPLIEDTQAQLATLAQAVADTTEANGQIIDQIQADALAALASLEANIADIQERVDLILAGGIPAADVAEDADRVFVTPAQKADIGQLRSDLTAQILDTADALAAKADLVGGKVPAAQLAFATKAQAEAGLAVGVAMDPSLGAQQIAALAGDVVVETFIASGTFTKAVDDFLYFVECIGGGGGGQNIATASTSFGGGGGGAYNYAFIPASGIGATVSILVGAGGTGGVNGSSNSGTDGGDSQFGSLLTARGGGGSKQTSGSGVGGGGQSVGTAGFESGGGSSGPSANPGGSSTKGGAGGGGTGGAAPGTSVEAGDGGAGNNTLNVRAVDGSAPGGGGGSSANNGGAGNGGRGLVRVTRFKRIKQ